MAVHSSDPRRPVSPSPSYWSQAKVFLPPPPPPKLVSGTHVRRFPNFGIKQKPCRVKINDPPSLEKTHRTSRLRLYHSFDYQTRFISSTPTKARKTPNKTRVAQDLESFTCRWCCNRRLPPLHVLDPPRFSFPRI